MVDSGSIDSHTAQCATLIAPYAGCITRPSALFAVGHFHHDHYRAVLADDARIVPFSGEVSVQPNGTLREAPNLTIADFDFQFAR